MTTTPYRPTEEAFLSDYFGIERPDRLKGIDIYAPVKRWIFIKKEANEEQLEIPHAVARLALGKIQNRLPQWYCSRGDDVMFGREITPHEQRQEAFFPRALFTINWADSGPGYSWPESYYVTLYPGFNRYVVTASADSTDAHGINDFDVGWFPADCGWIEGSRELLVRYWKGEPFGWDCQRWAYIFDEGEISDETANAWADEAWPDSVECVECVEEEEGNDE
ncbi:MAG: hypothetical protein WCH05_09235 [Chlorobiaceae bacterium]